MRGSLPGTGVPRILPRLSSPTAFESPTASSTAQGMEPCVRMAKKSQINRDNRRLKLIAKYADQRAVLRKILKNPNATIEEKLEAQNGFAKLPRNSCPTRKNNRCAISGRSKAYYNKFGISRIALRELALRGQLPGVRKSSW